MEKPTKEQHKQLTKIRKDFKKSVKEIGLNPNEWEIGEAIEEEISPTRKHKRDFEKWNEITIGCLSFGSSIESMKSLKKSSCQMLDKYFQNGRWESYIG